MERQAGFPMIMGIWYIDAIIVVIVLICIWWMLSRLAGRKQRRADERTRIEAKWAADHQEWQRWEREHMERERQYQLPIGKFYSPSEETIVNNLAERIISGSYPRESVTAEDIQKLFSAIESSDAALGALVAIGDPRAIAIRDRKQQEMLEHSLLTLNRVRQLKVFGSPAALPPLARLAVQQKEYESIAAIEAIEAILNRSASDLSADQMQAILALPDSIGYPQTSRMSQGSLDDWSESVTETRWFDSAVMKAQALTRRRRR